MNSWTETGWVEQCRRWFDWPGLMISLAMCIWLTFSQVTQGAEPREITVDLLIVGGTESGCAAAVQAARLGVKSIALVNDIDWLGGQFSAEALGAIDENRGPQGYDQTTPFPRFGLFKEVVDRIEALNARKYGRARPGNTRVITTVLPADAALVFDELVAPYVATGQLRIFTHHAPAEVAVRKDPVTVTGVTFTSLRGDAPLKVAAGLTIDASDWGDVIRLSGATYEFGPDLKSKYGEPLAPEQREGYPITDMNPITYNVVLREADALQMPIPAPAQYDRRSYDAHTYPKDPMFLYESRRLLDHYNFNDVTSLDALLLCFAAFDYPLDILPQRVQDALEATEPGASRKNIVEMSRTQRQIIFDDAKEFTLGYLHYLQTVVHDEMTDQSHSFRRFVLTDEFGTADRCPPKPYIRESLRMRGQYMLRQQDTTGFDGLAENYANVMPHDGIGCWQFEYDFHPTRRIFLDEGRTDGPWTNAFRKGRTWGPPYSGMASFPARCLVPAATDGLLGAQKNLGFSSIVSSAVRLHDQSMMIGQAAGSLAAVALQTGQPLRLLPYDRSRMAQVWNALILRHDQGEPVMVWPYRDLSTGHSAFEAVQQLAARRLLPVDPREVTFQPDAPADAAWLAQLQAVAIEQLAVAVPHVGDWTGQTRGDIARQWWEQLRERPLRAWPRQSAEDADGDGIVDPEDPLPFEAGTTSWLTFGPLPEEDGLPEQDLLQSASARRYHFTGSGAPPTPGFVRDLGEIFDRDRGSGWTRDLTSEFRRRHALPEDLRDSFRFTRSRDVWELVLPEGRYRVTACIGDSRHEQLGQNVTIEGQALLQSRSTAAGRFCEATVTVDVADGRLTVEIGRAGSTTNTCLNWVVVERDE
ncbi:MAG: FAD-dependent oxidoreductase [Planctomycetaceae bacterium]